MVLRVLIIAAFLSGRAVLRHEQTSTGMVKDSAGAVLPGVIAEAAGMSLIEKAGTNSSGEYKLRNIYISGIRYGATPSY